MLPIWRCLESRLNMASLVCALDLKRMLTNINLDVDQSIDDNLLSIKTITDALTAI